MGKKNEMKRDRENQREGRKMKGRETFFLSSIFNY